MHIEKSFWAARIASSFDRGWEKRKRKSWKAWMKDSKIKGCPWGYLCVFFSSFVRCNSLSSTNFATRWQQQVLCNGCFLLVSETCLQVHRTARSNTSHGDKPCLGPLPGISHSQRRPSALAP